MTKTDLIERLEAAEAEVEKLKRAGCDFIFAAEHNFNWQNDLDIIADYADAQPEGWDALCAAFWAAQAVFETLPKPDTPPRVMGEPDYVYNAEDWEATYEPDTFEGEVLEYYEPFDVIRLGRLKKLPDEWIVPYRAEEDDLSYCVARFSTAEAAQEFVAR
ncbi:MAG: hypothetical protein AAGF20_00280, partial [Pseudomonadota bacterium]